MAFTNAAMSSVICPSARRTHTPLDNKVSLDASTAPYYAGDVRDVFDRAMQRTGQSAD
jgi:hypothetical protein